jgi:DNA-binding cell septation regulator SpoVG
VPEIEVIEFLPINTKHLRAFAAVKVGDWIIRDFRIVQQDGQRAWVSVPQVTWKDKSDRVRYKPLLEIPGELKQRIEVAILSAWEKEKSLANTKSK